MQSAAQAYGAVARKTADPRDVEASVLLKAAANLQSVHDNWDDKAGELETALLYNRKLWVHFLTSVTREDNPLPAAIRQNIANLGIFVMGQTMQLTAAPERDKLRALININRELAAGLLNRPA